MDIAYLCVLIAAILPYVWVGYAKFSGRGYNNNNPREFLHHLEGKGKRANFAHLNAFEAFPVFAAAVIIAHLAGVSQPKIDISASLFIIFRILHGIFYIIDQAVWRSVVWFGAFLCVLSLFLQVLIK
jgi:uncharacterized MAPEG superfamily protein